MTPRPAQHAAIGDGRTTALVAADGAIDWYAPDGPDRAPSCYALLDGRRGGVIRLGPARPDWTGTQQVPQDEAPIAVTTFETPDGSAELVDHLERGRITRVLTVTRGRLDTVLHIVPGHALGPARRMDRWSNGAAFGSLRVEGWEADQPTMLEAGDRVVVTVTIETDRRVTRSGPELAHPTLGEAVDERARVARRWREEVGSVDADVPHRAALLRSVRALRLLTIGTTSDAALLRALTTSLPARIGNERNIDERFAWLRDNAAATLLWERLGRADWADAHRRWLHDRAGDELPLAPVYAADGARPRSEEDAGLPGWDGNGPVRVGQRAGSLLDLGALAAVCDVLDERTSWDRLERLGGWLAAHLGDADHGRWDERSRPRNHVESVLAARAALRSLIGTARRRNPLDTVVIGWSDAAGAASSWLAREALFGRGANAGWRRTGGTFADDTSDASLLPWLAQPEPPPLPDDGETEARHRARISLDQSLAQLTEGPCTHRHLPHVDDGFPPGQGADLWASFSMISALCSFERWDEAHDRMDALLALLGPTHVGATHVDPVSGELRGNLLAAPTHLALIDAALALGRGPR